MIRELKLHVIFDAKRETSNFVAIFPYKKFELLRNRLWLLCYLKVVHANVTFISEIFHRNVGFTLDVRRLPFAFTRCLNSLLLKLKRDLVAAKVIREKLSC